MKNHPCANIFPDMLAAEFDKLKADIEANGCRVPVVIFDGMILDGRHRWQACTQLGIEPPQVVWEPAEGESVVTYAASLNLARRQLTTSQKSIIGNRIRKELAKESTVRSKAGKTPVSHDTGVGRSADQAAKIVGTSPSSVNRAAKLERDDPEAYKRVEKGETTIAKARKPPPPPPAKKKTPAGPPPARSKLDKAVAAQDPLVQIAKHARASRKLVREIDGQPISAHFHVPQALADLRNIETAAKWALPHAICPTCGGRRGCKDCNKVGWVPKSIFEQSEKSPKADAGELGIVEKAAKDQWQLRQILSMMTQLSKAFNEIRQSASSVYLDQNDITQKIALLRLEFREGLVFTICPKCGGKKCETCYRQGWVTKERFEHLGLDEFEREDHLKLYPPPKSTSKDE